MTDTRNTSEGGWSQLCEGLSVPPQRTWQLLGVGAVTVQTSGGPDLSDMIPLTTTQRGHWRHTWKGTASWLLSSAGTRVLAGVGVLWE